MASREKDFQAPFGKVLITVLDEATSQKWHGHIGVATGICMVSEAVPVRSIRDEARNHRWVLGLVTHALGCIDSRLGWRSTAFEDEVLRLERQQLPLRHVFERLIREDSASGVRCEPWFSCASGLSRVGVSLLSHGTSLDVTVFSKEGAMYVERDFPVVKTSIRKSQFNFIDRKGKTLASVPLGPALTH